MDGRIDGWIGGYGQIGAWLRAWLDRKTIDIQSDKRMDDEMGERQLDRKWMEGGMNEWDRGWMEVVGKMDD